MKKNHSLAPSSFKYVFFYCSDHMLNYYVYFYSFYSPQILYGIIYWSTGIFTFIIHVHILYLLLWLFSTMIFLSGQLWWVVLHTFFYLMFLNNHVHTTYWNHFIKYLEIYRSSCLKAMIRRAIKKPIFLNLIKRNYLILLTLYLAEINRQ